MSQVQVAVMSQLPLAKLFLTIQLFFSPLQVCVEQLWQGTLMVCLMFKRVTTFVRDLTCVRLACFSFLSTRNGSLKPHKCQLGTRLALFFESPTAKRATYSIIFHLKTQKGFFTS